MCSSDLLKISPGGLFWETIHFPWVPLGNILQVFCKVFIKATLVGMFFSTN
nr:MAG TPA: hypothetical protein [Caudoviricetes sp.]